jgi:hypothetical protein
MGRREPRPDVPIHFTAFHPDWKMTDVPPTPPATLSQARRIALKAGIRYAYKGNIHDPEGGSTFCHVCAAELIGRDGYELTAWALEKGRCGSCGEPCSGVFEDRPGVGSQTPPGPAEGLRRVRSLISADSPSRGAPGSRHQAEGGLLSRSGQGFARLPDGGIRICRLALTL